MERFRFPRHHLRSLPSLGSSRIGWWSASGPRTGSAWSCSWRASSASSTMPAGSIACWWKPLPRCPRSRPGSSESSSPSWPPSSACWTGWTMKLPQTAYPSSWAVHDGSRLSHVLISPRALATCFWFCWLVGWRHVPIHAQFSTPALSFFASAWLNFFFLISRGSKKF